MFIGNTAMVFTSTNPPSGYYVYAYIRADDLTPYYIGKGKDRRAYEKHYNTSTPKNKNNIIILEHNLTEIGALAIERRMIAWYGRKDIGTGILHNKTDGGDGISGLSPSKETRIKMSIAQKGRIFSKKHCDNLSIATKGKIKSPEHRAKLSKVKKNNPNNKEICEKIGNANKGKKRSEETKQKISSSLKGRTLSSETRIKMGNARKGKSRGPYRKNKLNIL